MNWGTMDESERASWVEAAVMIPHFREGGNDYLILTKRTEEVLHHKGQICFPGGARDPEDATLWETALRECQEEIGLDPKEIRLVRELGRQLTPTGFRVTPYLGALSRKPVLTPNPNEIDTILTIPFAYFRDSKNVRFVKKEWEGRSFVDPHFLFEGHDIWGMTGRIVCELFEIQPG